MFKIYLRLFVIFFNKKTIRKCPISMTDADHDYILDEIEHQDKIGFERNVSGSRDKE